MRNTAFGQAMRRNRFLEICRFIHCGDNTKIDQTDKSWKIRPFMEMIKERVKILFQRKIYDECIVKYCGRYRCKQFIRGKPV